MVEDNLNTKELVLKLSWKCRGDGEKSVDKKKGCGNGNLGKCSLWVSLSAKR